MKNKLGGLFNIFMQTCMDILTVASFTLIVVCVIAGYKERQSRELEFIFGYKPIYIVSGSMEDRILKNSIVLLEEINGDEAEIGDIITFKVGNGYVTHRLIGVDEEAFNNGEESYLITKGDNNRINDIELLNPTDIKGRVVGVCNLPGYLMKLKERYKR